MVKDFVTRTKEEYRDAKPYRYAVITDDATGTTQTVWTPSSGKALRIAAAIISADSACKIEFRWGTTTFCHLEFESRKTHPIYIPFDLKGDADQPLNVYVLADSGTVNVYITVIGEEE